MNKMIQLLALVALLATLSLTAFAQGTTAPASTGAAQQCTDESKNAKYEIFRAKRTTDQAAAYAAAKDYLAMCPNDNDEIAQYLKKWVGSYEKETRKIQLPRLIYDEKKFPEAFTLGKQILADDPENLAVIMNLGYAGYVAMQATKSEAFNAESATYAKRAIQLIESGKTPEDWKPFKNKEDALGWLNYTLGINSIKSNPTESASYFYQVAQHESDVKKLPLTYYYLAVSYEAGPYAKLSSEYKTNFEGKPETPESKAAQENINQVVDRAIDAYARAVAMAGSDPKLAATKTEWNKRLTELYTYRNKSEAGLPAYISGVLAKPLPNPTFTPVVAPTPTPTANDGTTPASTTPTGTTPGSTPSSTPAQPAKPGTATTTPAKPATTTTTSKSTTKTTPRNKRHH
ncbi:MAG: hypothetical protein WCB68_24085 [Pyrinomonadaceae bacterium]